MLDMIELYGDPNNLAGRWRDISTDYDNIERINSAVRLGRTLKPKPGSQSCASVLRAVLADERYKIGRWTGNGSPQLMNCGLKSADGEFAIMLTDEEFRIFLWPPPEIRVEYASLGILKECVEVDDGAHCNTPLYW